MTVQATPLTGENLVPLADLKAHCRVDGDADDVLLLAYQQAAVAEIKLLTDDPTLFDSPLTDAADLAALHLLQKLLVADLYDRRYGTTAAAASVRWSNHTLALADKFHAYRLLHHGGHHACGG
jgi:hypothetical protein